MAVIVFGDSITNRANDTGGGWTSRLWNHIYNNHNTQYAPGVICSNHSVIELGIGGEDIVGIKKRFEAELRTRVQFEEESNYKDALVGIAVGVNDSRIDIKAGSPHVPIQEFETIYEEVVTRLKELGVYAFLVGLTPSDELKMNPCSWIEPPTAYMNESIRTFNESIKKIALNNHLNFVDVNAAFEKIISDNGPDELLADGIHPNGKGHQLIADLVYETIKPRL